MFCESIQLVAKCLSNCGNFVYHPTANHLFSFFLWKPVKLIEPLHAYNEPLTVVNNCYNNCQLDWRQWNKHWLYFALFLRNRSVVQTLWKSRTAIHFYYCDYIQKFSCRFYCYLLGTITTAHLIRDFWLSGAQSVDFDSRLSVRKMRYNLLPNFHCYFSIWRYWHCTKTVKKVFFTNFC